MKKIYFAFAVGAARSRILRNVLIRVIIRYFNGVFFIIYFINNLSIASRRELSFHVPIGLPVCLLTDLSAHFFFSKFISEHYQPV